MLFVPTGGVIMYGALILFDSDFIHVVSITFTSVLLTELLMVALTIHTWHFVMVLAELASLVIYIVALIVFKSFFGEFVKPLFFLLRAYLYLCSLHHDERWVSSWAFVAIECRLAGACFIVKPRFL